MCVYRKVPPERPVSREHPVSRERPTLIAVHFNTALPRIHGPEYFCRRTVADIEVEQPRGTDLAAESTAGPSLQCVHVN